LIIYISTRSCEYSYVKNAILWILFIEKWANPEFYHILEKTGFLALFYEQRSIVLRFYQTCVTVGVRIYFVWHVDRFIEVDGLVKADIV
jgi:hypothetical protein